MSENITAFYRGNTDVSVDFSAERVSSDGAVVLLDKLESKHKVISRISGVLLPGRELGYPSAVYRQGREYR